jgi:hypothetical protein
LHFGVIKANKGKLKIDQVETARCAVRAAYKRGATRDPIT